MKKYNLKEVDNFHMDNNRRKMVSFIKTAFNECLIYLGFILIHGIFAIISNSDELGRGMCHLEELRVEIWMECDVKTVRINIVSRLSQNDLASCQNLSGVLECHDINDKVRSVYNSSSGLLLFITKFNHTEHAGYKLWVNSTCKNSTDVTEYVLLKPCVSGFTTSAYHNSSHITISCENESFKMSDKGIRVVGMEDLDLDHCWWNKVTLTNNCFGEAEALANGFRLTTPYTRKMNISCKFDGQSVDIEAQEQTTTTMKVSSTKTTRSSMTTAITTPSEQTTTTTMHVTKPTTKRTTINKTPSSLESHQKTTPMISGKTKQISTVSLIFSIFIFTCIYWYIFI